MKIAANDARSTLRSMSLSLRLPGQFPCDRTVGKNIRIFASLLLLACALTGSAWAAATTRDQATTVAKNWLTENGGSLPFDVARAIQNVQTVNGADGAAMYFVVNLNPTGFVIVSADDQLEPIIAFVGSGEYSGDAGSPLVALLNTDLQPRLKSVREKNSGAAGARGVPHAAAKWTRLQSTITTRGVGSVTTQSVAPFVQSLWNQQSVSSASGQVGCYNYYAPPFNTPGSASNDPCGCVATAMAQLMRYHQWPTVAVGTGTFTVWVNNAAQSRTLLGGNGSGGAYSWSNMPLAPDTSITTVQCQNIGRLCYDAGLAVGMSYSASGSGATMEAASSSLRTVFKYSNSVCGSSYTQSGLTLNGGLAAMVNPNLDAGLPVLFGINGPVGGHAIVCDGYGYNQSTMYHHLNLGWGGYSNAWYNLPNIDAADQFNVVLACVYNVYKAGSGEIISGLVTDSNGTPISGAAITATISGGASYNATTNANGIYALAQVPSAASFAISVVKAGYSFTSQNVSTGTSSDNVATTGNKWAINFTGTSSSLAPSINSASTANGVIGRAFSFNVTATGNPTSYAATNLPAGLSLNTSSGLISGTPTTAGTVSVSLTATNANGNGTGTLSITIVADMPPAFTSAPSANPNPAKVGQAVTFTAAASDTDGDAMSYAWDFGDGSTGTGAAATHTYSANGTYTVTATVSDSTASTSQTLSLTVSTPSVAMKITSGSLRLVANGINKDTMALGGTLPLGVGFRPAGKTVLFSAGNLTQSFTLNTTASGTGSNKTCTFKLSGSIKNGAYTKSPVTFLMSLKGLTLTSIFPQGVPAHGTTTMVNVAFLIDGTSYTGQIKVKF